MRTILNKFVAYMAEYGVFNWMPDKPYLKLMFWARMGRRLNLDKPRTFNEKLQWLKLNDRKTVYTQLVDKYEAKKYMEQVIGSDYVIPTIGVWESFDEIDFEQLPERFVLKCTHDSGGLVICNDKRKLDIQCAREKINKSLNTNYYFRAREWPYKDVKPRIIAEEYLESLQQDGDLLDYKVFCFNSVPKIILVCSERFSNDGLKEDFYDIDWKHLNIQRVKHKNSTKLHQRPLNLDKMIELAKRLSAISPFLRVDFYELNGKVYCGELTFFPASGFEGFRPEHIDDELGKYLYL